MGGESVYMSMSAELRQLLFPKRGAWRWTEPPRQKLKEKPKGCSVYTLCEPTGEIRYVAVSSDPASRFKMHLRGESPVTARWIEWLRPKLPVLRVLCVCTDLQEAERVENELIAKWKKGGKALLNRTRTIRAVDAEEEKEPERLQYRRISKEEKKARREAIRKVIDSAAKMQRYLEK